MATQSRADLKTYFQTNDIPSQDEFGHLIDSSLNLADPGTQIISGSLSASFFDAANGFNVEGIQLEGNVSTQITESNTFGNSVDDIHRFTGSIQQSGSTSYFLNHLSVGTTTSATNTNLTVEGNISASGTIYALKYGNISSSNVTSSGNVWAKGYVSASSFNMSSANLLVGSLTSNGIISSSGTISGSNLHIVNNVTVEGDITSLKTGSFEYLQANKDISASGHLYAQTYKGKLGKQLIEYDTSINVGTSTDLFPLNLYGNVTASGNISASGNLYASASNANGSHDNVLLYDTSTGRIYHTGSYGGGGGGEFSSDLDWDIQDNYITSSKAVHITASSTNPALNVRQNSSGYIAKFLKNGTSYFSINSDGRVGIGPNADDFSFNDNNTVSGQGTPTLNIKGAVRIKSSQPRLYLEDSTAFQTVWTLKNHNGKFSLENLSENSTTNGAYIPLEIEPASDDDWYVGRGGAIKFSTVDGSSTKQETLTILGGSSGPRVGINKTNPQHTLDVSGDINTSGTVYANGSSLSSDVRLKENIKDLEPQINNIKNLKPRRFDWKHEKPNQFNDIGFIAQELQEVIPELITDGPINPENGDRFLYVAYNKLTPILVKAVQEHQSILEDLEQRLNALENK